LDALDLVFLAVAVLWTLVAARGLLVRHALPDLPPRAASSSGARPSVTVVVPARDEEARIAETVERLLAQEDVELEVVVVDDRSRDRTAERVRALAQRDARIAAAATTCLREVASRGRELSAYGARDSARDLKALREALGIRRWNLLAVSYGTLIALEAARIDRDGVRSLILDSIVSPRSDVFLADAPRNFSQGLDSLLAACDGDAACHAAFPDLVQRLHDVIATLGLRPATVTVAGAAGEGRVSLVVNWHDFLGLIHWMLYSAQTLKLVPALIDATARDDLRLLARLTEEVFPAPRNGPQGAAPVFFMTACRDQFSPRHPLPPRPGNPAYRGFSIVSFMETVCAASAPTPRLGRPPPLRSAVPALLLSGRFDPMTPWPYARDVARTLPNALRVVVADAGHSTLSDFNACQTRLAVDFLDELQAARADACRTAPGPVFATDMDAILAPAAAR